MNLLNRISIKKVEGTHARTHECTRARKHARTHARTRARTRACTTQTNKQTHAHTQERRRGGLPSHFPHTQQLPPGLLNAVAQFIPGRQRVPTLPGPVALPVHSMPTGKPPLAHQPLDAYCAHVKPAGFDQPGVSTQVGTGFAPDNTLRSLVRTRMHTHTHTLTHTRRHTHLHTHTVTRTHPKN